MPCYSLHHSVTPLKTTKERISKERYDSFSYFLKMKCVMLQNVLFLIIGFFPLYEVKLEWGIWNQVLLEKQVCIALEWKQIYDYQTAQSLFLQSFPFSLPVWSVASCIINSPMVPLSRNISVLRLSWNTATYLFRLYDAKKLNFFESVKSSVLFLLWL